MKVFKKIIVPNNNNPIEIAFGVAETQEEKEEIYKLRYRVYVERERYITTQNIPVDKLEIDSYDREDKCIYFIAKVKEELVGTVRIIKMNPLPIQKNYYSFEEPEEMKKISDDKKFEIGRLISTGKYKNISLPRHLVMLGLFDSILIYTKDKDIEAGYGAIKEKILRKISKLSIPFREIKKYKSIFIENSEDPLDNFFNNPNDPVCPIYFLRSEAEQYFSRLFASSFLFKKTDKNKYIYRGKKRFIVFILLKRLRLY